MTQAPSPGVFRRKFLSNSFGVLAMAILFSVAIILTSICAKMTSFAHGEVHKSTDFCIILDNQTGHIKSLRRAGASNNIEFLREDRTLGPVSLRIRKEGNSWRDVVSGDKDLELRSMFELLEAKLRWNIVVFNTGNEAIEIGDLDLPLPMNTVYTTDPEETYTQRVFKHAFISGHASFLYWLPVKGTGPFLVMMPDADAPGNSHLEYFTSTGADYAFGREEFSVLVHSKAFAETNPSGTWRQPRTSCILQPGQEIHYAFTFQWADSYEGVRELRGRVEVLIFMHRAWHSAGYGSPLFSHHSSQDRCDSTGISITNKSRTDSLHCS